MQPLAGEWAIRRSLFETLAVPTGYAVELAALLDTVAAHGTAAIAQVDLGRRAHDHQPLLDLGAMATQILAAVQRRSGREPGEVFLTQYESRGGTLRSVERAVITVERPPAVSA